MDAAQVSAAFEAAGLRARVLPLAQVDEAVTEIQTLYGSGRIDAAFVRRYAHYSNPGWHAAYPGARSVLLAAVPAPLWTVRFTVRGRTVETTLPPTYAWRALEARAAELAESMSADGGHPCRQLSGAPLKRLAVGSELCAYGRNNITYCEGFGSYLALYGFVTGLAPADDAPLGPIRRLPACENCTACAQVCPCGCIRPEHPVIRAERCLTCLNENGGDFPAWLPRGAHNALVGCMLCQHACPQNRGMLHTRAAAHTFDEEETVLLCAGGDYGALPAPVREALHDLCLDEYWPGGVLSRNLRALLAAAQG